MIGGLIGWGVGGVSPAALDSSNTPIVSRHLAGKGGGLRRRASSQKTTCRSRLRRLSHPEGCRQPAWENVAHGGELAVMWAEIDSIPWSAPCIEVAEEIADRFGRLSDREALAG